MIAIAQEQTTYPVYTGSDLGVTYQPKGTKFKVWAPNASEVVLRLYPSGLGGTATKTINLKPSTNGVWEVVAEGDLKNQYYTFQVKQEGKWLLERPDIYAKAVGANGLRGMVADMRSTNPKDWEKDKRPQQKSFTDIIIYETHVRDLSISPNSGIKNKGKFLGFTEAGTKSPTGESTGLDHLKELGITHVHLLPSFDFSTIDETKLELNEYNWGYDPANYNVPEGSYATDPYDGNVRIKEFKQLVKTLHDNSIRVILDVVYNHTSTTEKSNFNQFAPGYYYRLKEDGSYSDASGCGNETASERAMMRKFIVESVAYWAKEYHIDGFRFDLMGIHDIETMNQVSETLHKIDPTIFVYGEGWTAGGSPLPEDQRAIKINTPKLQNIAAFSDDIRDGLRGPFSNDREIGFVSGKAGTAESVKFGIVAATQHPQINYHHVNYSKAPWANEPSQCITYVSCHDDHTLFDRLKHGNEHASEEALIKMDKLAHTTVLTSQGVVFLHAGAELLRTKQGVANSYKSPDAINQIDWSWKNKYKKEFEYYKALVALRKNHPAFRMSTTKMIQEHLRFHDTHDPLLISYEISGNANGDKWKQILVLLNGNKHDKHVSLPAGEWTLAGDGNTINEKGIRKVEGTELTIPATTAYILFAR
ncbi:type I pullulanase [Aridibaculum aurantiacum]|uniref:type I pullulanase n=1 Tax=Aridibaculum aurantiacum TaxID=2810307 RepID=UPI001A9715A6|nr:type I pullulanase [Aridibaculum aurantiacum]